MRNIDLGRVHVLSTVEEGNDKWKLFLFRHRGLRLILMSATVDTHQFLTYFPTCIQVRFYTDLPYLFPALSHRLGSGNSVT
jgi:hypothetical protein